jgi:hypothetical protein
MKPSNVLLLCGLVALPALSTPGQEPPTIAGYVTRAASGSDFDVNGVHVVCTGVRRGAIETADGIRASAVGCPGFPPFIGEGLEVYGALNGHANSVDATRIEIQPSPLGEISGAAVIDAAPAQDAPGAQTSGLIVRADGYRIRITGKTKIEWSRPLQSLADVKAGDWIKYKGKTDPAGEVVGTSVQIGPNAVGSEEEKLRVDNEYDPLTVPADARQNYLRDVVRLGLDPKRFPPFKDAAMQARIEKIGSDLVPAYQRALAGSDPAKIDFRFQLIDTKLLRDALTLPNGIILVPHQVVERLQNDSQLAAVLADGIARALERQQYRTQGERKVAWLVGGMNSVMAIRTEEKEQSGRVSLVLLHDAGYDIDQAPVAWWLLDPFSQQPLTDIEIPDRAIYLYSILGETWHNPAAIAAQAH